MEHQPFTVKYISNKNCFLHFSEKWTKKLHQLRNVALKVSLETNSELYFSWSSNPCDIDDNSVGINAAYAKCLGLKGGANLSISCVENVKDLARLSICPISQDDWEILELNADVIQNTLLNYLNIVNLNQNIVIWVSNSMPLVAKIVNLPPNCCMGRLKNFTEIEIIPVVKNYNTQNASDENGVSSWSWKSFFGPNLTSYNSSKIFNKSKVLSVLNQYQKKNVEAFICRVYPLGPCETNKELETIFKHPFNVYIRKKDVPEFHLTSEKKDSVTSNLILCKLKKLHSPEEAKHSDSHILNELFVRVIIIEDLIEINNSNELFTQINTHSMAYFNENILKLLHLRIGSRVVFERVQKTDANLSEIQITACSPSENSVILNIFKLFILDNEKLNGVFLNAKSVLKISSAVSCYVNFVPEHVKYANVNGDVLRNVKVSVNKNRNEIVVRQSGKLVDLIRSNLTDDFDEVSMELKEFKNVCEKGEETLVFGLNLDSFSGFNRENILLTGQLGSGKTTMAKYLAKKVTLPPHFVHVEILTCKSMKGKKLETVHKHLVELLDECVYYQPSILILDDLDSICEATIPNSEEGLVSSETQYFNRMSEMISIVLTSYQSSNYISYIVTAQSASKLNSFIYTPRGEHTFSTILEMPVLDKASREYFLKFILDRKCDTSQITNFEQFGVRTEGFVIQDLIDLRGKVIFENIKRDGKLDSYSVTDEDVITALDKFIPLSFRDINLHKPSGRKWDEIGGMDNAKSILTETIYWPIKYPEIFGSSPIRLQTGILIYGHPGTGKTILAGAAAQYFGLRLISVKGPELLSKYIGASEESVRNIFEKAQSAKPCILFFDEFDSLAPRRGHDSTGVTDRVVNQFLTQLDGVEPLNGVYVMAATSRPDLLDPALIRPGRLGRQIHCPLPDQKERKLILEALKGNMLFAKNVNLNAIAKNTNGYTGADLQGILYTAQLKAIDNVIKDSSLAPENEKVEEKGVEITQENILEALKETNPSLSFEEKKKYDAIYAQFQGKKLAEPSRGAIKKQRVTLA